MNYATAELDKKFRNKCSEYNGTLENPDWGMTWNNNRGSDGTKILGGCTKAKMERYLKEHKYSEPLRISYADKKWALQRVYLDELEVQREVAEAIALISPPEIFRLICGALCRTDVDSHYRFMDRARRYREELITYFQDNQIFSSYLYFTPQPPEKFKTANEIVRIRTGGKYKTLQEYGASGDGWKVLRTVEIPESNPGSYPFLNLTDIPKFQWQTRNLTAGFSNVIKKVGILAIISVSVFYLSFVSFIRYDVR